MSDTIFQRRHFLFVGFILLYAVGVFPFVSQALSWAQTDPETQRLESVPTDQPVPESTDVIPLPEMTVTASREERARFDIPRAVTIVDRQAVERRAPALLPDLLRGESGVFVQQTTPGQAAPIIRGLLGSATLMLVDGMRLNTAFFRPAPNQYFALVDPYLVERLEVVRGAGSALYGSDAMGGVMNVITPVPRFDSTQWQWHGRAIGQFGSADTSGVTRVALNGGKRGIGIRAGFTYRSIDDVRGGGNTGVQRPSGFDVHAADGTLFGEWGRHAVFFNGQYLQQPKTPRFDELVPGFGQTQPSSAVFFFEPNDRFFVHGRYRVEQPASFLDRLEMQAAFQEINDDRRTRDFDGVIEERERNRSRLIGVSVQLTSHWRDWMLFIYGGEVYLDTIASQRLGQNIETGEIARLQSRFADGSTLNSFAGYLQTEIWLHPRLTAVLGGRFSSFDIDIPRADREVGVDLGINDLTGRVGLVYHLTPTLNLVTNVGRGFRVPNVFDLSTLGPRPGNRFNVPNPNLNSEEVVTVDLGAKWHFLRFRGEMFGFYTSFQDKISAEPIGVFTPEGRQIVQSQNLNSVKFFGVEAASRWRVRDRWELFAAFTYTWGEEEFRDGRSDPASRIPPANGRIGCVYEMPAHVWNVWHIWVEGFLRFAAEQDRLSERDRTDPRINPNGTPGWVTANLRLGWDINEYLSAQLALENLFDASYREYGSGINAPGVNAIVTLETRF